MHPQHIIFDLDGTLIDSASSILFSLEAALRTVGVEPIRPVGKDLVGPPLAEIFDKLCEDEVDSETRSALARAFKEHYDERGYREATEFEGVGQVLCELRRQGKSLFLATNKRMTPTRRILAHFGWSDCFSDIYTVDAFGRLFSNKVETVAALLRDWSIGPNTAVYIGDREDDYVAARENDVRFVMAKWGYGEGGLDFLFGISKPRDLVEFVCSLGVANAASNGS